MTPTKESVQEILVSSIISAVGCGPEQITLTSTFESLNFDSLDIIELHMALEDEFDIDIFDEDVVGMTTVGEMLVLLCTKLHVG